MPHFGKERKGNEQQRHITDKTTDVANVSVEEIIDLIVSNFNSIPSHRRLHLFQSILGSLQTKYLPLTILILLLSPYSHPQQTQQTQQTQQQNNMEEEMMDFCRELLSSFSAIQILECISSMLDLTQHFPLDYYSWTKDSHHFKTVFWWLFKPSDKLYVFFKFHSFIIHSFTLLLDCFISLFCILFIRLFYLLPSFICTSSFAYL
jgi:hypothetical protein